MKLDILKPSRRRPEDSMKLDILKLSRCRLEDSMKLDILKQVVGVIWIQLVENRRQLNAVVKMIKTLLPGIN